MVIHDSHSIGNPTLGRTTGRGAHFTMMPCALACVDALVNSLLYSSCLPKWCTPMYSHALPMTVKVTNGGQRDRRLRCSYLHHLGEFLPKYSNGMVAPNQPQCGSSSVLRVGKEGLVTFVTLSCLDGMRYDISRFSTVRLIWPCLKSCCLPVPSVAAISPFQSRLY